MTKTVRKSLFVLLATFLALSIVFLFANFTDVKTDHWAYSAISKMQKTGILSGYSDGTFRPENNITINSKCSLKKSFKGIFNALHTLTIVENLTSLFTSLKIYLNAE